jgi:hypothetical protein
MRKMTWLMLAPLAVLVVACGRKGGPAADDALKNDLALASQVQSNLSSISPTEAGNATQQNLASRATPAVTRRTSAPVRRTSSTARSTGSRSSGSTGGYYPAPTPTTTTVEKHTGRDAAIGAAAGAVIGATTSRDKVKGGLIGAAAGGILGAVIGNNVDVHRKVGW